MLLGISLALVALVVAGYSVTGVIGSGALIFSAGFALLAMLAVVGGVTRRLT